MKTVLVTGAAGFIGSKLVQKLLSQNKRVVALDSLVPAVHGLSPSPPPWAQDEGCIFYKGDVNDKVLVKQALSHGPEVVYHLASETGTGESMYSGRRYYTSNVMGTLNLLEVISEADIEIAHFVLSSSRSVYGEGEYRYSGADNSSVKTSEAGCDTTSHDLTTGDFTRCPMPTRESAPLDPKSLYASTKAEQENLVRIFSELKGFEYSIFRFQNVYGPGQSLSNPYTGILAIFSNRLRVNQSIELFEYGLPSRDFVYVDDVLAVIGQPELFSNQTINVGTGRAVSVATVAELIRSHYRASDDLIVVSDRRRKGDIFYNTADTSRLAKVIDVGSFTKFEDGLKEFLSWADKQGNFEDRYESSLNELSSKGLFVDSEASRSEPA